jgi:LytS/YehU family sensor histidine kinase
VNKQTAVSFRVPFPFYKTTFFYGVMILPLIILVSGIGYFRIRYIKKKEHEKTKINKQYAALELKALQAQMNPHFLFNCLNTIKYFITTGDNDSAGKYLNKFSKLMRMFLEHSKSNTVTLNDEIELLNLYIELERMRFENGFNYTLSIEPELDTHSIVIPGMLFQPFVENAINHGLRNLNRIGHLNISFFQNRNTITGVVEDDGIGREKAAQIKEETGVEHASRGLQITGERVNVINYIRNMNIVIMTEDLKDEYGGAKGTKVTVNIPFAKK